jgi:hypothetical protein
MKKQLGLISPDKVPSGMTLAGKYSRSYMDIYIYVSEKISVFLEYIERPISGRSKRPLDQLELPTEAFLWLVDAIENKFWKSPKEGGLDGIYHMMGTFDGEEIRIGRAANIGAEGVTGFSITNYGRSGYIDEDGEQDIGIPDVILKEEGLFEKLKAAASFIKTKRTGKT